MPKKKTRKLENSWIDVGDEEEVDDKLTASTSSSVPTKEATKLKSPINSIPHLPPPNQSTNLWNSDFIMPALEKESRLPQAAPASSTLRRRPKKAATQSKTSVHMESSESSSNLGTYMGRFAENTLIWILSIIGGALYALKRPLSFLLAAYMFMGLLIIGQNILTSRLSAALSPICRVPGVSFFASDFCASPIHLDLSGPDVPQPEFDELMNIQTKFEDLLLQTGDDYAIPAFMKQSQLAMRDVREVVRFSQLRSKNELVFEFNGFIDAASQASWDLETFNSHVGRTVDKVLLTARWTQRALDDIAGPNGTRSSIGTFVSAVLAPFQPMKYTEDVVLDQYIKHSDAVQSEISDLLLEAQAVFALLRSLEETLDAIHGIAVRDTQYAEASRDEVLALLWTKLGGNSRQVNKFQSDLKTLKKISMYGQTAYTHIAAAVLKLQSMSAEIDQLKERLVSVDPIPGRPEIPLGIHLENIRLGVQRLEEARAYSRDRRTESSRQVMDKARGAYGGPDEFILGTQHGRKGLPGE